MFTGIIRARGEVLSAEKKSGSLFLNVSRPSGWKMKPGDSIAINGVCLTVLNIHHKGFTVELIAETLIKTSFGKKIPERVNLEKPLRFGDELGGHFVTGHVDTTGRILKIGKAANSKIFRIGFPPKFSSLVALKGSVALDGISLTVVETGKGWFTAHLTDYTLRHTTLESKKAKDLVNLEFDVLAKYSRLTPS